MSKKYERILASLGEGGQEKQKNAEKQSYQGYNDTPIAGGSEKYRQILASLGGSNGGSGQSSEKESRSEMTQTLESGGIYRERRQPEAAASTRTGTKSGMSGEASYSSRKAKEEEADERYKSALWDYLGLGLQQTQMGAAGVWQDPEQQAETARRQAELAGTMREAKEAGKEARKAVEWDGRQELVDEVKQIEGQLEVADVQDPERQEALLKRRREIIDQLSAGDLAAGNGERVYSWQHGAETLLGGAGKRIAGMVGSTAVTLGRAVGEAQARQQAWSPEAFLMSAKRETAFGDASTVTTGRKTSTRSTAAPLVISKTGDSIRASAPIRGPPALALTDNGPGRPITWGILFSSKRRASIWSRSPRPGRTGSTRRWRAASRKDRGKACRWWRKPCTTKAAATFAPGREASPRASVRRLARSDTMMAAPGPSEADTTSP